MRTVRRFLIVDDAEAVVRLLVRYLVKAGHEAKGAASAEDALELLARESFDLIFLDDGLPKMMGLTAIPEIQKLSRAPIVMITGLDSEDMRKDAALLGAHCVLLKPIEFEALAARVRELLGPDAI
ncbi:MAG: response regulator [Elusimicrobiota bacterium]|jgi:DNA-binding response OmpR family regulator